LNFQFDFLQREEHRLAELLQTVVDKDAIVQFAPKNLADFYQVCFIIDHLKETPANARFWFVYALSFFSEKLNSLEMAQLVFCIDFLYAKIDLQENELMPFAETLGKIKVYLRTHQKDDGRFETSLDLTPKEELRNFLFIVNLIEDLIQDSVFYYHTAFNPVNKIFEEIVFPDKVAGLFDAVALQLCIPNDEGKA
jgi:hypothetical protein